MANRITAPSHPARRLIHALALAVGTVMVTFVPISHLLKHIVTAEPRYHHFVALRQVHNQLNADDMVFVTPDRLLLPFIDSVEAQFRPGNETRPAAYIIFAPNFFGDDETNAIIADFSCLLATRAGRDIVWGILFEYVRSINRASGRATFEVRSGMGPLIVEYQIKEILDEFYNGFYVRGDVLEVVAPAPNGGTRVAFPLLDNETCATAPHNSARPDRVMPPAGA